jgi:hypothetical protein
VSAQIADIDWSQRDVADVPVLGRIEDAQDDSASLIETGDPLLQIAYRRGRIVPNLKVAHDLGIMQPSQIILSDVGRRQIAEAELRIVPKSLTPQRARAFRQEACRVT